MSGCLTIAASFVFFEGPRAVEHVAEMIFALLLVRVLFGEVFFVGELEDDGEETE